ncbi:MAG TPA: DUF4416 family protein [Thermodesulfovibrionia bacterium]|nr:DUF4416 family protein [Thermodesulfovibrionia bacterium]
MSEPGQVKLFTGMLAAQTTLFEAVEPQLEALFGQIDLVSPVWSWNHTTYYEKELGKGLLRKFVFFKSLIHPQQLPEIKLQTIALENKYLHSEHLRLINLDPGYLNAAKVVLASTKDYSHRLYLSHGIYGEVTLAFSKSAYRPFPYTYPDFRTEEYLAFFEKARGIYKNLNKEL